MTEPHGATHDRPAPPRPAPLLDPAVRRVLESSGVAIGEVDPEGHLVTATAHLAAAWGQHVDDVIGRHLVGLWPEAQQVGVTATMVRLLEGASELEQVELVTVDHDGTQQAQVVTLGRVADDCGRTTGLVCAIGTPDPQRDEALADRRRRAAMELVPALLANDADPDAGPGPMLDAALRRSARLGRPLALLRCEVSGLAEVVTALGDEGPARLEECWDRLFDRLRSTDVVLRTADDTFLVIAGDLGDEQDAAGVAYRLLSSAIEPIAFEGGQVSLGMTIGVVIADAAASPERMLEVSVAALDEARRDGGGGFRLVDIRSGLAA